MPHNVSPEAIVEGVDRREQAAFGVSAR
jgi:hypothetical protein